MRGGRLRPFLFVRECLLPHEKQMRIFYAFLIILVATMLWMLPITSAIYDFRTDLRTDTFSATTAVGEDSANVTLLADLYDCDMGSIDIDSDDATDAPMPNTYNCTSRELNVSWLTDNTTRILDVSYDSSALKGNPAIDTLLGWIPYIWILIICVFPMAALFAIFTGKV